MDTDDVFGYPRRGADTTARFLVGAGVPSLVLIVGAALVAAPLLFSVGASFQLAAILIVLGIQLVVGLYWLGYFVAVLDGTYAGRDTPPAYDEWGRLFRNGAGAAPIVLVYTILFYAIWLGLFALILVPIGSAVVLPSGPGTPGSVALVAPLSTLGATPVALVFSPLGTLLGGMILVLMFGFGLLTLYFLPIGLCCYADDGLLRAFDVRRIGTVALHLEYAVSWGVFAGFSLALTFVVYVLSFLLVGLPLVPVMPFVLFFVGIAGFRVVGRVYADAVESAGPTA